MDMNSLTQIISTVGFPIVCCIYFIIHANKTVEKNNETLHEMTAVVKENTTATNQLITLISYFLDKEQGDNNVK